MWPLSEERHRVHLAGAQPQDATLQLRSATNDRVAENDASGEVVRHCPACDKVRTRKEDAGAHNEVQRLQLEDKTQVQGKIRD